MTNPLLSKGRPNRYLYGAVLDLLLALAATGMAMDLVHLDIPKLDQVPAWVWPAMAAFFFISAAWSYRRHRAVTTSRSR